MTTALCVKYPARGPDLVMHLCHIVHCAPESSKGMPGSLTTDCVHALYNEAFSGRAKPTVRCKQCLGEHHSADACPDIPRGWTLPNENPPQFSPPARKFAAATTRRCATPLTASSAMRAASVRGVTQYPGALEDRQSRESTLLPAVAAAASESTDPRGCQIWNEHTIPLVDAFPTLLSDVHCIRIMLHRHGPIACACMTPSLLRPQQRDLQ